jgi:hypothetical protein
MMHAIAIAYDFALFGLLVVILEEVGGAVGVAADIHLWIKSLLRIAHRSLGTHELWDSKRARSESSYVKTYQVWKQKIG